AFLLFINQHTGAFARNYGHRHFELLPAVTAQATEYAARQGLEVNSNQRGGGVDVSHEHGCLGFYPPYRSLTRLPLESQDLELSPPSRKIGSSKLADSRLGTHVFIIAGTRGAFRRGIVSIQKVTPNKPLERTLKQLTPTLVP